MAVGGIVSVVLAYLVFGMIQGRFIRANDEQPQDVQITNVTGTTATITWKTPIEADGGVIQYGVSPAALGSFAPIEGEKSTSHVVDLSLLTPATTYYFQIVYGENKIFDNGGAPWTFVTKGDGEADAVETGINLQSIVTPTPIVVITASPVGADAVAPSTSPSTTTTTTTTTSATCDYTDCDQIKSKLGKGCSTQEYMRCIKK